MDRMKTPAYHRLILFSISLHLVNNICNLINNMVLYIILKILKILIIEK